MLNSNDKAVVLDHILAHVPAGVVHVSGEGQILLANDVACRFLGFDHDQMTDRYTVSWQGATFHEDGRPCGVDEYPVTRCLVTGMAQPATTIGVEQPDGEVRWAVFTALPAGGGAAVVTLVDITDRMRRERERQELHAQLQRQDRLASMGQLAAGVAHEINNPLTYVLANLDWAKGMLDPDSELGRTIAQASEGAERVRRIVRDLSRFSRTPNRTAEAFDPAEAVHTAIAMSRAEFRHRAHIELQLETTRTAWGHPDRLVQVLVNLLVNAAHAIEPGHAEHNKVTVTLVDSPEGLDLSVRDTGSGMDAQTLDRALDPFFTTKELGHGTGLGLSISHQIMAAMGGELTLHSILGEGTTVTLRIAASDTTAAEPVSDPDTAGSQRPLRILVVDDEPAILAIISRVLREHDLTTASAGDEALDHMLSQPFDLVLCDLLMPRMTGMDLHRAIAEKRPEMLDRMVFMTAGAFTRDASAFVEAGQSRILMKPFDMQALSGLVREVSLSIGTSIR